MAQRAYDKGAIGFLKKERGHKGAKGAKRIMQAIGIANRVTNVPNQQFFLPVPFFLLLFSLLLPRVKRSSSEAVLKRSALPLHLKRSGPPTSNTPRSSLFAMLFALCSLLLPWHKIKKLDLTILHLIKSH